jgi:SAM-dependent methyltransferase
MDEPVTSYDRFRQRYLEGKVPWADHEPPPEIIELTATLPVGRALDLGCGFGRSAIYLARQGWTAVGVDFVPEAIAVAEERAAVAGVAERVAFHAASAADMPFLEPPFDLALDIGCMHSFDEVDQRGYRDELLRLLPPGGVYVLFAHLRTGDEAAEEGPRGIAEETIRDLFRGGFVLYRFERGVTQVEDRPPWESGWFWYRRR